MPDLTLIATVTIFIATYAVVGVGKVPVYRIDRAGAALLGGSLMLAIGVLTPQEAYRAIDFDTITLLLGMMIVVATLRVCGFFRLVTDWIATHVRRPLALLVAIALASSTLSVFLVNDTICEARVAGGNLRRQFHPRRLRRQSRRCSAGEGAWRRDRILGVFQGRGTIEPDHDRDRAAVAVIRPFQFFILWP